MPSECTSCLGSGIHGCDHGCTHEHPCPDCDGTGYIELEADEEDQTMVDLGGGMVVPLSELMDGGGDHAE